MSFNGKLYKTIVENALFEDIGSGDLTTDNLLQDNEVGTAEIITRQEGIIAGLPLAELTFKTLDSELTWEQAVAEGSAVAAGTALARITGRLKPILTGERVALNFLQRLSAIATKTNQYVKITEPYKAKILDTRKTTPGLRILEKYAVRIGGGTNHRFGLYDAVMIKDNHIRAAGGIKEAVALLAGKLPFTARVEVEVETLGQVSEALEAGADIIMLDNMSADIIKEAVGLIDGKALVEASGGVTLETVETLAATGVDYISVGALTHSVQSLDIALNILNA